MELSELTSEEAMVLVGFMRIIVRADGEYSDEERQHVAIVERALGAERFQQAMLDVRGHVDRLDELKAAAKEVTRPEARQMIYKVLANVAASDETTPDEEKPLRWLASWWKIGTPPG
jgi:hypothetical protein